ncbi:MULTISPECIES: hypothetical protein [Thiorhodovibrio]|uniref:hypothetical protein n=1 Tax=Thiorhodovibrio TaxID=61593 RepID=UPI0019117949|nr:MULTISPECIES: hypothetical protein [Thiorhodovibrio]MBK5967455.1 hypothetical protein [Thiorhodovibrio winogradskyi]WPL12581.1 hypothetical protein Thiosp_02355 [Thiorhodovibrio litoralis]
MTTASYAAPATEKRHVLLRALIWAIVGVIYAPLFLALEDLFRMADFGPWSFVPAAALAGGAGAMLYGARQVAIAASLIGVSTGSILLLIPGAATALWQPAVVGLLAGVAGGLFVTFPGVCTSHVVAKAVTGIVSGAVCGTFLALVEPHLPLVRLEFAAVAFLVSVNGVIYVSTLSPWMRTLSAVDALANRWKQALVIGVVAMVTAASVWIVSKSITGEVSTPMAMALMGLPDSLPVALMAGAAGGAITGALLEIFRFRWVLDV